MGTYSAQCAIVLWLGIDSTMRAMYSLVNSRNFLFRKKGKYDVAEDNAMEGVLSPLIWMLLVLSCYSSYAYADKDPLCQVKHYLYPILILCMNRQLWRSLVALSYSAASASHVLLLFACVLFIYSAVSMLLLQGLYNTGDFYTDNQYDDLFTSFTTMFIFLASGIFCMGQCDLC